MIVLEINSMHTMLKVNLQNIVYYCLLLECKPDGTREHKHGMESGYVIRTIVITFVVNNMTISAFQFLCVGVPLWLLKIGYDKSTGN